MAKNLRSSKKIMSLNEPPQRRSCKRESAFFVREFVKMKKFVREFVKTMSFVIREKKKYRS